MVMEARTSTNWETDKNLTQSWFQKFFGIGSERQELVSRDKRERRGYFRLKLKNIRTIGVEIQNGSSFKTVITDLSAGGFSCTASKGFKLSMDKPLDVNFVLPLMDENAPISTKAVYIGRKEKGSGHFQTGRFEFVDDISDQERDTIHGYILKEQFELMNAKML